MRDIELYAQILGIQSPWRVTNVELGLPVSAVRVFVELTTQGFLCPDCGKPCKGYDSKQREWRHLNTCQYPTIIVGELPRVECPDHGVKTILVPWAEPGSRFTILLERFVIDLLKDAPISVVAEWTGLSWDQVDGIQGRAVKRGLTRKTMYPVSDIGVDETSSKKGHNYMTIVHDKETGHVLHVVEGKDSAALDSFYKDWKDNLIALRSISMDMSPAFISSTRSWIIDYESKMCFDKFHVMALFNRALDIVRRRENSELKRHGDETLVGTKYDWLHNASKIDGRTRKEFMALSKECLKTSRAWAIKEAAGRLWDYGSRTWALKGWKSLTGWMQRCRIEPVVKLRKTVTKHLEGILNAIILNVDNAKAESINSKIQKVKRMACGFRNMARFRNSILFHFGGLDLYPASPTR